MITSPDCRSGDERVAHSAIKHNSAGMLIPLSTSLENYSMQTSPKIRQYRISDVTIACTTFSFCELEGRGVRSFPLVIRFYVRWPDPTPKGLLVSPIEASQVTTSTVYTRNIGRGQPERMTQSLPDPPPVPVRDLTCKEHRT
ncbi:hypothetical protein HD806DRAFT_283687 [Xylariaceae sp. AK1471]|nr:hypothetical protein HD806DRAFT_283687 [Xylariaceae sp. AK1471]